ncbi:MAG: hypothetical protein HKN25_01830 [Pyrinomonadaceae bacterium]|nr:hypothetical protein [Pyrinomonadaceae bacterium]
MDIGTAEPIKEKKKKKKLKRRRQNFGGPNPGDSGGDNNGGGGGGDNKGPRKKETEPTEEESSEKSKVLMWFLLLVVIMTFGGLIGAYVVISTNNTVEWRPFSLPIQVWISTAIILASSVTYHLGKKFVLKDKNETAKRWFLVTTVLGASFISSQVLAWLALVNRGLYMRGNPYAGFFYILTAIHAVHVLGGIAALGYVILRNWNRPNSVADSEKRKAETTSVGWYWHTMDALWLVLLFLLGFWK